MRCANGLHLTKVGQCVASSSPPKQRRIRSAHATVDHKAGAADAFYVAILKNATIDEKNAAQAATNGRLTAKKVQFPWMKETQARRRLMQEAMQRSQLINGHFWVTHPLPSRSEPDKHMAYLTDRGPLQPPRLRGQGLEDMHDRASLIAIYTFFHVDRARRSNLKRGVTSARRGGRVWHCHSPYDPAMIEKFLTILRVWYNYYYNDKKRTANNAIATGDAKGPVRIEGIIYFSPKVHFYWTFVVRTHLHCSNELAGENDVS